MGVEQAGQTRWFWTQLELLTRQIAFLLQKKQSIVIYPEVQA